MSDAGFRSLELSPVDPLLDAARQLAKLVDAEADAAERAGTMTPAVVDACRQTGLFWAMVPAEVGGGGADAVTTMEIIEELTRVDGSTGWSLMANMTATGSAAAYVGDRAVDAMFASPPEPAICAGMLAPRGTAVPEATGYVVSGRYSFGSGIAHATWTGSGCFVREDGKVVAGADGGPQLVACAVPIADVRLEGNWDVHGMRATGSYDYSIDGAHVDGDFTFPLPEMARRRGGAMYDLGLPGVASAAHAAIATGLAIGALQQLARSADRRRRQGMAAITDQQLFLHELARIEGTFQAARSYVQRVFVEAETTAAAGRPPSAEQRHRLRQATTYVTDVAGAVVRFAYAWSGSAAIRTPGGLARVLADMDTAAQHIHVDPNTYVAAAPSILDAWTDERPPLPSRQR